MIKCLVKLFTLQFHHSRLIQVLTQLFRCLLKLRMIQPINIFLNTDDFFHNIDALYKLALRTFISKYIFLQYFTFARELSHFLSKYRVHFFFNYDNNKSSYFFMKYSHYDTTFQNCILSLSHEHNKLSYYNKNISMNKTNSHEKKYLLKVHEKRNSFQGYKSSTSLFLKNPLTKPSYSLCDTSPVNFVKVKDQMKRDVHKMMRSRSTHDYITKKNQKSKQTFSQSSSYQDITHSSIPQIPIKKPVSERRNNNYSTVNSFPVKKQNLKFKLLFRDQPKRKTPSERKIDRLDRKIHQLELHKRSIKRLIPKIPAPYIPQKIKPKGMIVPPQKIDKLLNSVVHNIELYFNMYNDAKKVGGIIKGLEGFNQKLKTIFFKSQLEAKRFTNSSNLHEYFWAFKPPKTRAEYFGEQDETLYNLVQNFVLKMEKSFEDVEKNYIVSENLKLQQTQQSIAKQIKIYQKKFEPHPQITKINRFIENRKRHGQQRREDAMKKLESLGVRFNVQERSRQLVIRSKEKVMGKYNVNHYVQLQS